MHRRRTARRPASPLETRIRAVRYSKVDHLSTHVHLLLVH